MAQQFWDDDVKPGHLKAGLLGFEKSGKTMTAVLLALVTRMMLGLKGPLGFFDTETGSVYVRPMVEKFTGQKLLTKRARSLDAVMSFGQHCIDEGVSVGVVDSVTHIWRAVCESYLEAVNRRRAEHKLSPRFLEIQDWAPIKKRWALWANFYLNSPLSLIACGRAGFEYEWTDSEEQRDGNGKPKKELNKTGIKMKAEGEFGYEASLLIQMVREQEFDGSATAIARRAIVIGDRFGVLDGKTHAFPSVGQDFDKALAEVSTFFKPHLALLISGGHASVDTSAGATDTDSLPLDGGSSGGVVPISLVGTPAPAAQRSTRGADAHANPTAMKTWQEFLKVAQLEEFTVETKHAMAKDFGDNVPAELQTGWYRALGKRYEATAAEASTMEGLAMLREAAAKDWMGAALPAPVTRAFEEAAARLAIPAAPASTSAPGDFGPPPDDDDEDAEPGDDGQGPVSDNVDTWCGRLGAAPTLEVVDQTVEAALDALPERYRGMIETAAKYARERLARPVQSVPAQQTPALSLVRSGPPQQPTTPPGPPPRARSVLAGTSGPRTRS